MARRKICVGSVENYKNAGKTGRTHIEYGIIDRLKGNSVTIMIIKIRGRSVSRREDYKRFIVFCLASLVIIAQAAAFAYVWYDYYRGLIEEPFWRKGNWALIAIYALINTLFSKLYGGLKVGYLKKIDVFYSLTLATICTNVVAYFQITLINRWFLNVGL